MKFGDVARNVTDTVTNPATAGIQRAVGLEHLDPEELTITRWASTADGLTFTRRFRPGQLLYGRRRVYQRKAAVPHFEGVCSGDIYVLEPSNGMLRPELLPFVVRSDSFHEYALRTSAGSLSPRTKWADLSAFEFDLPPMESQLEAVDVLTGFEEVAKACSLMLTRIDTLSRVHRARFFSSAREWKCRPLGDIAQLQLGKMLSQKAKSGVNPKPYLTNINVRWRSFDLGDLRTMDFNDRELEKFRLEPGDVLACEGRGVGRSAVWKGELAECYYQKALHRMRVQNDQVLPEYLVEYFAYCSESGRFVKLVGDSLIPHLTEVKFKTLLTPVPPVDAQERFVNEATALSDAAMRAQGQFASVRYTQRLIVDRLLRW